MANNRQALRVFQTLKSVSNASQGGEHLKDVTGFAITAVLDLKKCLENDNGTMFVRHTWKTLQKNHEKRSQNALVQSAVVT